MDTFIELSMAGSLACDDCSSQVVVRAALGESPKQLLTNEAGMLLMTGHFYFWNCPKAGMLMKTRSLVS